MTWLKEKVAKVQIFLPIKHELRLMTFSGFFRRLICSMSKHLSLHLTHLFRLKQQKPSIFSRLGFFPQKNCFDILLLMQIRRLI